MGFQKNDRNERNLEQTYLKVNAEVILRPNRRWVWLIAWPSTAIFLQPRGVSYMLCWVFIQIAHLIRDYCYQNIGEGYAARAVYFEV